MVDVVAGGAVRTPIGRFGGGLQGLSAAELGAAAVREALRRTAIEAAEVEETAFGCARQAGGGPNVARQVSFRAGIQDVLSVL
jgi:acetyl-CoA C-acetyltransferase